MALHYFYMLNVFCLTYLYFSSSLTHINPVTDLT